jgi:DNA polymerase-3 subunit gamma/tau
MSYVVLARKYRPRTFAEVAGQDVSTRTLQGAIAENRIGHAYLFTGPRGTGKTTTARIFAKALLCAKGPAIEPCLECDQCRDIEAGSHVDVIEMDAASNRGIEHARELRERVAYTPMRGRFKVYIVDEVHQLTKEAFNALLKTLEEPPAHVKFLFATTDLNKVIETVRSRCQIVRLSLIREETIAARLDEIFALEGVTAEAGVSAELAKLARGSLRDALSITDQLLALVGNTPTLADVNRVAPAGGPDKVEELLELIEQGDRAGVLRALPASEGNEPELAAALLDALRTSLLCLLCPDDAVLFENDASVRERGAARAKRLGAERLEIWLEELLFARERMERLPRHARIALEITLLELCRKATTVPLAVIEERLLALEQRLGSHATAASAPPASSAPAAPPATTSRSAASSTFAPVTTLTPAPRAQPANLAAAGSTSGAWVALLEGLTASRPALAEILAKRGKLLDVVNGRATVQLGRMTEAERAIAAGEGVAGECQAILSRVLGVATKVVLEDTTQRASGTNDAFTRSVADVFQGQIEDA